MKNCKDMEAMKKTLEKLISQNYKPSLWSRIKETISNLFSVLIIAVCVLLVIYIIVTFIENPVSLAIICLTVLLIFIWSKK